MGKGVGAHNGLVVGDGLADDHGEQAAARIELGSVYAALKAEVVLAHHSVHDHFFQGCVAGPLANAAQGHFHLACAHLEGCQGVGYAKAKVVVAVYGEDGLFSTLGIADDVVDEFRVLGRLCVAHCVGKVDGGGTGSDGCGAGLAEEVLVRAGGVLAGEFNVGGIACCAGHAVLDHGNDLVRGFPELVGHVQIAGGQEGVDAGIGCFLDGFPAAVYVLVHAAGKATDLDVGTGLAGNGLHGLEVALA